MMEDDRGRTMATTHEQHTTCLQPHETLLVGWIAGGMTEDGRENNSNNR